MKFYRKDFCVYKDWITVIPTIQIHINNAVYTRRNVSIEFDWLTFHARFMWKEGKE